MPTIERARLREFLGTDTLRHGHMLIVTWPRLRDKTGKDENGHKVVLEPAGTLISRRVVLRRDWATATPSGSFVPKNGIMFNVASQEQAAAIRANNDLYLFLSLEANSHPYGEQDHPVNVPLNQVISLKDTRSGEEYRIVD